MNTLPCHGKINCRKCFQSDVTFDVTLESSEGWRIKNNPLAWGNEEPEIVVLGFSKGPTQSGALNSVPHNEIAYKGGRTNIGKIFKHIGLIDNNFKAGLAEHVSSLIEDKNGRFHFGSLIRCTVERFDVKTDLWKGSGGGMLDKFVKTGFGQKVVNTCTDTHLSNLPSKTKLIVMFGLGTKLNYVDECFKLYNKAITGKWGWLNEVSYSNGDITVVHVEHFQSQGALIPNWLGINNHHRSVYGEMAKNSVLKAFQ